MNHEEFNNYFTMALVILLIGSTLIFVFAFKDGISCTGNTFTYLADKLSTPDSGDAKCSCFFQNPKYSQIYFDKNNVSTIVLNG